MINVALAGNPNSGKTTLFNTLTGSTAHVGNWPGVTVEQRVGVYKKKGENPINIVDLPGIYSLSPYTPEEVVARNYIIDEKPSCIINIVDATNLERNLYLTTQLLEIDVPMVIALNMTDEVEKFGDKIDASELEQKIGVPVVCISALREKGIDELMEKVAKACSITREGFTVLENTSLMHLIGDIKIALSHKEVDNSLFHAIKLVEKDEVEVKNHKDLLKLVEDFKGTMTSDEMDNDFEAIVADSRYRYITANYSQAYKKAKKESIVIDDNMDDKTKKKLAKKAKLQELSRADRVDRVLTSKWFGIPIFLLILFAIFHFTFSENFLFLGAIPAIKDFTSNAGTAFEGVFIDGGLMSPGVILQKLMEVLTGAIAGGITTGLESISSPAWVQGFLVDGVWGGLSAVLSFIPQILLLFLLFSILEDSGYMARVAFILDRIFRKLGVSGRAFMPMIMGFGCSVPAMINTRTLADDKERLMTLRVIPFFSCGAKLPILAAISGAIGVVFGLPGTDFITYGMYLIGMVTAFIAIVLMKNTTQKGEIPPFIMELPNYRCPKFTNLMLHLWDKLKHYIQKAFTIILASTIIIWVITHFSFDWKFLPDSEMDKSILAGIGMFIQPLFTPLGFGSQLTKFGWVFAVAAITGLIAKENVIATFGVLAAVIGGVVRPDLAEGVGETAALVAATGVSVPALIAFIAFNMTTIPCFAAVATARAEMPTKKDFHWTLLFWIATSYIVASIIYLVGEFYWPIAIVVVIAILLVAFIILKNKNPKFFEKFKVKRRK